MVFVRSITRAIFAGSNRTGFLGALKDSPARYPSEKITPVCLCVCVCGG